MRQTGRPGDVDDRPTRPARRQAAGAQSTKTFEIVMGCAVGALVLLAVVELARVGSMQQRLDRAEKRASEASNVAGKVESLTTEFAFLRDGLDDMGRRLDLATAEVKALETKVAEIGSGGEGPDVEARVAEAVDAEFARRRDAFRDEMRRRGEEMRKEWDRRIGEMNLDEIAKEAREFAARMRKRAEPGDEEAAEPRRSGRGIDEAIADGADGVSKWAELRQKREKGEITREEYDQERRKLREDMRKRFEERLTPEERKRLEELFGRGGRGRGRRDRRDSGEGDAPEEGEDF